MTEQEHAEWVRNHALCSECRWPDVPMNQSKCPHCHNKECWEPKQNTVFEYLYRDGSNYKMLNDAVLKGAMTEKDLAEIRECLHEGEWFIPSEVGLEGERFSEETEDDHPWFEVTGFRLVPGTVTDCGVTVSELVRRFKAASENGWAQASE